MHQLLLSCYEVLFLCCRPLWVEFPREEDTFAVEDQYMIGEGNQNHSHHNRCGFFNWSPFHLGGALLACPVTAKGIREMEILLPGSAEVNQPEGGALLFFIPILCSNSFLTLARCGMTSALPKHIKEAGLWVCQSTCWRSEWIWRTIRINLSVSFAASDVFQRHAAVFLPLRFLYFSAVARWSAGQQEVAPAPLTFSSFLSPSRWRWTLKWAVNLCSLSVTKAF